MDSCRPKLGSSPKEVKRPSSPSGPRASRSENPAIRFSTASCFESSHEVCGGACRNMPHHPSVLNIDFDLQRLALFHLSCRDILSARMACKAWCAIASEEATWSRIATELWGLPQITSMQDYVFAAKNELQKWTRRGTPRRPPLPGRPVMASTFWRSLSSDFVHIMW